MKPFAANSSAFNRVKVLICESNPMIKQALRIGLNNLGIREIAEASNFIAAHKAIGDGGFDVLIMNTELDNQDTEFMVREVRLGQLGPDPFVITMLLLAAPNQTKLRNAIDCGADDLLLIPFSPDQTATRLGAFKTRRKPFVITHDYVGPDRRKNPRPGDNSAPHLHAPNPVASRAAGMPHERYDQLLRQAKQSIGAERIKRLAAAAEWECRSMMNAAASGRTGREFMISSFFKLETLISELADRATTQLKHDSSHFDDMMDKVRDAKNRMNDLKLADFDVLHSASRRIAVTYTGG